MQKSTTITKKITRKSFECYNCGKRFRKPRLFCSDLCRQEAKLVRYVRSCQKDGRINQEDVIEAIQIKFAHILSGGYPAKNRYLSQSIRTRVIEQAKGLCQLCGEQGTEIDHIDGDSNDLDNLQLLCHKCHLKKTKSHLKELTSASPGYEEKIKKQNDLIERIESIFPLKICDDEIKWQKEWKSLYIERKNIYSQNHTL